MTYYFNNVYINNKYSLLASKKFNPIVLKKIDKVKNDYYFNKKTIEEAESEFQFTTVNGVINKSKIDNIDLMISSDLQNQLLASNYNASKFKMPFLGIYSACASFCEGLIIASNFIENNNQNIIVTTSSHNLVSEKQFRFPVEYGAIRKKVNSCTCSGSISTLISNKKSNIKVESATVGNVICTNHNDSNDMGSAMAPSACEVLRRHLTDTKRTLEYYDLILTGDLGMFGSKIMNSYYNKKYKETIYNHIDAGSIFYEEDNIFAGASGPLCLPLVLFDYIIPSKKYKKILLIATGSLHSVLSSNLSLPIPGVSHAVSLEVE